MSATFECRTEEQTAHHKVKAPAVPSPAFPYIHVSRRQQPGPLVISGNLIFFFFAAEDDNDGDGANPRYAFRTEYFPVAPIDRYCYLPRGSV